MSLSPDFPHDTSDIGRMLDIQLLSTGTAPVVEARSAPLVVTSTADYTYNPSVPLETAITYGLTLHQAIGYANDGDRIVFAEDITSITLHYDVFSIGKQITIDGGENGIRLTGASSRFDINATVGSDQGGAVLQNISIDAASGTSWFIDNQGTLTLRDVEIINSKTDITGANYGTAQILRNSGDLHVDGLSFIGNQALAPSSGSFQAFITLNTGEIHVAGAGLAFIANKATVNVESSGNAAVVFENLGQVYQYGAELIHFVENEVIAHSSNAHDTMRNQGSGLYEPNADATGYAPPARGPASIAFTENGVPILISSGALIDDADGNLLSLTITLDEHTDGSMLAIAATHLPPGVSADYQNGTLTLAAVNAAAGASPADFQSALRQVTYVNGSDDPVANRVITISATDMDGQDSAPVTIAVNITAVNDAPTLTASGVTNAPIFVGDDTSGPLPLFSAVEASAVEAGQLFEAFTITVSQGTTDDVLLIGGTEVRLLPGSVLGDGQSFMVTKNAGTGQITVKVTPDTPADAATIEALIGSIAYRYDGSNPDGEQRTIAVASLTDDGGGNATATFTGITATVTVRPEPVAPVVYAGPPPLTVTATDDQAYDSSKTLEQAMADGLSLREALGYAQHGERIVFANDITTVTLASLLTIDKQVTIDGGADRVTLKGSDGIGRLLLVTSAVTSGKGGAVLTHIDIGGFSSNMISDPLISNSGGTLSLRDVAIRDISVSLGSNGSLFSNGGAGKLHIDGLTIENNSVTLTGAGGTGKLIENYSGSQLHVTGSGLQIVDNTVSLHSSNNSGSAHILGNQGQVLEYGTDLISSSGNQATRNGNPNVIPATTADPDSYPALVRNDAPDNIDFTEDDSPVLIAPQGLVGDADGNLLSLAIALDEHTDGSMLAIATTHLPSGISADYQDGVLTLSAVNTAAGASPALFQSALRQVTFVNDSDTPAASRVITIIATDVDNQVSPPTTITVNITAVNDAPQITGLAEIFGYAVGSNWQPLQTPDYLVVVIDPDTPVISGGSLMLSLSNAHPGDNGIVYGARISTQEDSGGHLNVLVDGQVIGSVSNLGLQFSGSVPLTIQLTNASLEQITVLLQNLQFHAPADAILGERLLQAVLNDGQADSSLAQTRINVVTPPTVTISSEKTAGFNSEPFKVYFDWNAELPPGVSFSLDHIEVSSGELSDLRQDSLNPARFEATYTPQAGIQTTTVNIRVDSDVLQNLYGHGNVGDTLDLTGDTRPPRIGSVARADGDELTNASAVTFTVTFTEALATEPGIADFALAGNVGAGEITQVAPAAGANSYIVTVSGLENANGTLGLLLAATSTLQDTAGNAFVSRTAPGAFNETFTIDTTAPLAPTGVALPAGGPSNTNTVTVDLSALEDGATWAYSTDGGTTWTPGTGNHFTLNDGDYGAGDIQVRQIDAAGNPGTPAGTAAAVTIDTLAPEAPALTSADLTNAALPLIAGTAEADSTVVVSVGGAAYTVTANADGQWSIDLAATDPDAGTGPLVLNLNDENAISVTATDAAGNMSTVGEQTLIIDTTAPQTPTGVALPVGGVSNINTVTVDLSVLEEDATWEYSLDGGQSWHDGDGNRFTVPDGTYAAGAIQVRQIDAAGNPSAAAITGATAFIDTAPPVAPAIALGSQNTDGSTLVNVLDLEPSASWQYSLDGGRSWTDGSNAQFVLPSGMYAANAIQIRQFDDAGNMSAAGRHPAAIDTSTPPVDPGEQPGEFLDTDGDGFPDHLEAEYGLVVGVKDNDVMANDHLFVMQLYRDLLGREAEQDGLAYWQDGLAAHGHSRAALIQEFQSVVENWAGPVARLYTGVLDRLPDQGGLRGWMTDAEQGADPAAIADAFLASDEFLAQHGMLGDESFVDFLYHQVLGREAETDGRAFWLDVLAGGASRGQVAVGFTESDENLSLAAGESGVILAYTGLLGRMPDADELAAGLTWLDDPLGVTGLFEEILASAEYHDRFLPTPSTQELTLMGLAPDEDGTIAW